MSGELQSESPFLAPQTPQVLDMFYAAQEELLKYPQIPVHTEHILHGGMYVRTVRFEAGTINCGSIINKATVIIVNGSASIITESGRVDLEGYNIIPRSAGRKQMSAARGPIEITMIFATNAKTVREAEDEVFGESSQLKSRLDGSGDTVTVTGE